MSVKRTNMLHSSFRGNFLNLSHTTFPFTMKLATLDVWQLFHDSVC